MRTICTLIGIALFVLLLAGGSRVEGQDEQRVYLPVMVTPPQRIALARPNGSSGTSPTTRWEIVSVNADGTDPRLLAGSDNSSYSPAWSPRGDRIAFISTREITPQLYLMRPDGQGQTRLTSGPAGVERLRWSPDGSRIAFADAGNGSLWLINADGSGLLKLEEGRVSAFSWAPDGTSLAYSILGPQDPDTQIYGGQINRVRLTDPTPFYTMVYIGTRQMLRLAWSPDGTQIAFSCEEGLCAIDSDGSNFAVITPIGPNGLAWSPDSAHIALSSDKLYLIDRDGGNQRELFAPGRDDVSLFDLQWSPDGNRVGVHLLGQPASGVRDPANELWIVGLDGSKISLGKVAGYSWSR